MSIGIMSWNNGRGARALSQAVTRRGLLLRRNTNRPLSQQLVYNMGCSRAPRLENYTGTILNIPEAVHTASNKLSAFRSMLGHCSVPRFTTSLSEALDWMYEDGLVVARHKLRGNSGSGIEILTADTVDSHTQAPLYTRFVPKNQEYRVHCTRDCKVIDVRRKAKRRGHELNDFHKVVWNHSGGFVFKIEGVVPDTDTSIVCEEAIKAVRAVGLDIGAVDIGYNTETQEAWVFEVNSAPGLEGSTVEHYANYLRMLDTDTPFIDWRDRS